MSLTKSIGKNSVVQLVGRIVSVAISFYIVILLTRFLGVQGYGEYNTVIAYLNFFAVIADFGLYLVAARAMGSVKNQVEQEKIFNNSISFRAVSAFVLMALAVLISLILPYSREIKGGIAIFSFGMFFYLLNQVIISIFQVKIKTFWVAFGEVAGRVLVLIGIYIIIGRGYGLLEVMWYSTAGFVLNFVICILAAARYLRIKPAFNLASWKYLLRESWPIGVIIILTSLLFRADSVFISLVPLDSVVYEPAKNFSNSWAVGIYGPPARILDALYLVPGILLGLVMPQISRYFEIDKEKVIRIFEKVLRIMIYLSVPLAFFLFSIAFLITLVVAGQDFIKSVMPMQILAFAIGFNFISSVFYYVFIGVKKQNKLIKVYLGAFIFNVIVNLFLIFYFSYLGAAITSLATQAIIALTSFLLVKNELGIIFSFRFLPKVLLSSVLAGGGLFGIQNYYHNALLNMSFAGQLMMLVVFLILGVALYSALLFVLRAMPSELVDLLKKEKKIS